MRPEALLTSLGCLVLFAACTTALANDSALNEGAYGPEPLDVARGKESPIRLVNEHLRIEFGAARSNVVVTFHFQNPDSTRSVRQLTGFPDISLGEPDEDDLANFTKTMGPLLHVRTFIDGHEVKSKLRRGRVRPDSNGVWTPVRGDWHPVFTDSTGPELSQIIAWHVVELRIPPRGNLTLERRYSAENAYHGLAGGGFYYILHTAAGWRGTVGKLTADLILLGDLEPDELDWTVPEPEDSRRWMCIPGLEEWRRIDPRHYRLVWTNFEPATDANRRELSCESANKPMRIGG